MLTRYAIAYVATGLVFAIIDALWLNWAVSRVYRPVLGDMLAAKPRMDAAIAFYLIYLAGIMIFAVRPAFAAGGDWRVALLYGALFGFFAYATYDLTNQATLKVWAWKITLADIAWGTFLTGTAAAAGTYIANALRG